LHIQEAAAVDELETLQATLRLEAGGGTIGLTELSH
jgi:hypothetical protein